VKSKIALAVAVALAILTAVGLKAYIEGKTGEARRKQKMVTVLAAARDIKKGEAVYGDMVREVEVEQRQIKGSGAIFASELGKIVKEKIVKNIKANGHLRWSHFRSKSRRMDPAKGMAEGYRQIAIPVDKVTGCAGRLLPGTIVDVLVTLRVRRDANSPVEPVTQMVLTGVRVVATDLHSREVYEFLSARERRDYATYSTVTLRALPLQTNLLAFLADQGKIHLVIRGPDDGTGADPTKLDKITLDNLDTLIRKAAGEKPETAPPSSPGRPRR